MTSWVPDALSSHKVQLAVTAVVSGAVVASAIIGLQTAKRAYRITDLKDSIPSLRESHNINKINDFGGAVPTPSKQEKEDAHSTALATRARLGDYDDDLILEQLARNRVFLTDDGLAKLRNAFIIIVGCGGVGSHATAALARSGAGKIRLIDFDQVTLSSLNRHAVATLSDVGTSKVQCLRRRLEQVVPWTKFDCINELFNGKVAQRLLGDYEGQKPDFVIDAIDNIDSKVELLAFCRQNDIPVVSAMGAGTKSDPTRVFIGDISASTEDPLSRHTRRRLRMLGVRDGIPCVYSQEKPGPGKATLLPLAEGEFEKGKVNELGVLPDFRVRILPVLGTMPAVFGLCAANHVMLSLAEYPMEYLPSKGRDKMYDAMQSGLQGTEERLARTYGFDALGLKVPVTQSDVGYLVDEVWHGRSVVSGLGSRLALIRWRKPEKDFVDVESVPGQKSVKLALGDLVCMTKDEANKHEKLVLKGDKTCEDLYDAAVFETVRKRQEEEKEFSKYR